MTTKTATGVTRQLASYLADLRFEDLPGEVVARTEELFLDWVSSALAGRNARPVEALEWFTEAMGPDAEGRARYWPRAGGPLPSSPPW